MAKAQNQVKYFSRNNMSEHSQPPKERQRKTAVMLSVITCLFMGIMGYEIIRNNDLESPAKHIFLERVEQVKVNEESLPLKVLHAQNKLQAQQITALKIELNETAHRLHEIQLSLLSAKQASNDNKILNLQAALDEKGEENHKLQALLSTLQVLIEDNDLKMTHMEQTIDSLTDMLEQHQMKKEKTTEVYAKRVENLQEAFQVEKEELVKSIHALEFSQGQLKTELGEHYAEIVRLEEELAKHHHAFSEKEGELLSLAATLEAANRERQENEAHLTYHIEAAETSHQHLRNEFEQKLADEKLAVTKVKEDLFQAQTILTEKEVALEQLNFQMDALKGELTSLQNEQRLAIEDRKNIALEFDQHKETHALLQSELASLRVDHHTEQRNLREQLSSTQEKLAQAEENHLTASQKVETLSEQLFQATNRLDSKEQEWLTAHTKTKTELEQLREQITTQLAELQSRNEQLVEIRNDYQQQKEATEQLTIALNEAKNEIELKNLQIAEDLEKIAALTQISGTKEEELVNLKSAGQQKVEEHISALERLQEELAHTKHLLETQLTNLETTQKENVLANNQIQELQSLLEQTKQENKEASEKMAELQAALEDNKTENSNAQDKVLELQVALEDARLENADTKVKFEELQASLEQSKDEHLNVTTRANELQSALEKHEKHLSLLQEELNAEKQGRLTAEQQVIDLMKQISEGVANATVE